MFNEFLLKILKNLNKIKFINRVKTFNYFVEKAVIFLDF